MTTKTINQLINESITICNTYNLKQKGTTADTYQYIQLESIYNALINNLNNPLFKRVKKQFTNCIYAINHAINNDLITFKDYVYINFTKNFINRGVLINSVLMQYLNYFTSINQNYTTHLLDINNASSIKQFTTNQNTIIVCDSGIYLGKAYNCNYHYDFTSDKNKKIVKKLTNLKNVNGLECLEAW